MLTHKYENKWEEFKLKHNKKNLYYHNLLDTPKSFNKTLAQGFKIINPSNDVYVILSADMLFEYSLLDECLNTHYLTKSNISLFYSNTNGKWKSWSIEVEECFIKKITYDSNLGSERYCLIINKNQLNKLINSIDNNDYIFKDGITGIIEFFLNDKTPILAIEKKVPFVNINDLDDLRLAHSLVKKIYE